MTATATITRSIDTYSEGQEASHLWSISEDGKRVAELWIGMTTGEILMVWTHDDHREQGHATALYRQAASEIAVYHAPPTHRFDDGARFAERVGGPSMPDCTTCCAHLYDDEDGDY
jgi:hypothetical protein